MNICPNLRNKKVKQEFDELVSIFGEEIAYFLWDKTNGNGMELAPNGASSRLFSDLLKLSNGDRRKAIIAKAKVFGSNFKDWFGDWQNPLKQNDIVFGHPAIGKTYSIEHGKYKDKIIDWDVEFNEKRDKWIENHSNTTKGTPEFKKARNEYLIHPEKHEDYVKFITSEWKRVKNKAKKEGKILFASPHTLLKMFPEDFTRIINVKSEDFVNRNLKRGGKEKESILWKEGIDDTLSNTEGIQTEYLDENQYFEDYLDKYLGVSKVVDENGEPLVVYHGSKHEFSVFKNKYETYSETRYVDDYEEAALNTFAEKEISILENIFEKINDNPFIGLSELSEEESSLYNKYNKIVKEFRENNKQIIQHYNIGNFFTTDKNYALSYGDANIYAVFLNIRSPKDSNNLHRIYTSEESIDKLTKDGYDGLIGHDVKGRDIASLGKEYFVINSNQIKSAIDNNGNFSKTDNNIYHSLYYSDMIPYVIPFLRDSGIAHMWGGKLRLTKYNPAAKLQLENFCNTYGLYADIKDDGVIELYETDDKDEIREHVQDMKEVNQIIRFLQQRFPGLKARWVSDAEIKKATGRSARACVKGDTVFLSYQSVTADIAAEELLHPFVTALQHGNNELFTSLYYEAVKRFPKLAQKIDRTYTDKLKFSESDRRNELVTQVLSRYLVEEKRKNLPSKLKDLISTFVSWITYQLNRIISRYGSVNYIDPSDLPRMSFKELAKLINTSDTVFGYDIEKSIKFNLDSLDEISSEMVKAFGNLYDAYRRIPNKSSRREKIQNEIYEKINELKTSENAEKIALSVKFALKALGQDDGHGMPQNYDPNDPSTFGRNIWSYLLSQKSRNFSGLTADEVVGIYKNSIGFYKNLFSQLKILKADDSVDLSTSTESDADIRERIRQLSNSIDAVEILWKQALRKVTGDIVDDTIDEYVTATQKNKDNLKIVYKDWLYQNSFYGDISKFEKFVVNYGQSSNPVIKMAFNLIEAAQTETLEEAEAEAAKLNKLFRKANKLKRKISPAWQTIFMEKDRNGIPTGRFVRRINYGQYEQDLNEAVRKINDEFDEKYGHHYEQDETGEWVNSLTRSSAEEEQWGDTGNDDDDMPVYVKYMLAKEKWICDHANRRYTYEYYKERLSRPYNPNNSQNSLSNIYGKHDHGLSPKTLFKYNHIQSNINYYLDKCIDEKTGFTRPELLSPQDMLKFDMWNDALRQLSNPFNEDGTLKTDDEYTMSMEIQAWQKWISERMNTETKYKEYLDEHARIQRESPQLLKNFEKYNSRFGINLNFISQTIGQYSPSQPQTKAGVKARILKAAISKLASKEGSLEKDLRQFEDKPMFWMMCHALDVEQENDKNKASKDFVAMFAKFFNINNVLYTDENGNYLDLNGNVMSKKDIEDYKSQYGMSPHLMTYHRYLVNKYTNRAINDGYIAGLIDITDPSYDKDDTSTWKEIDFRGWNDVQIREFFEQLFTYERSYFDKNGMPQTSIEPLSIFTYITPSVDSFKNSKTGQIEPTIVYNPTGRFSKKDDPSGIFVNNDYDTTSGEAVQPMLYKKDKNGELKPLYKNDQYDELMKQDQDVIDLYNELINSMHKYYHMCTPDQNMYDYRLPQINAENMALVSRAFQLGFKNVGKKLFDSIVSVQENDTEMRSIDSYITNPDGSRGLSIPRRFTRMLDDPSTITTDIVSAVKLYAHMAINYKNSQAIESQLEALMYEMDDSNRIKQSVDDIINSGKNSHEMFKQMMETHLYDNQWDISESDSKNKIFWKKLAKLNHRTASLQMLAINYLSMGLNFLDQVSRIFTEATLGKHFSIFDFIRGIAGSIKDLPKMIANIGNPIPNTLTGALMRRFGISKNFIASNTGTARSKIRRIAGYMLMGGFSMLDYLGNAILLRSRMNAYRFYDGDEFEKGFYTKTELKNKYIDIGLSPKDAKAAAKNYFNISTETLLNAYYYSDGQALIKPKYEPYINRRIKKTTRSFTIQRGALVSGINPDNDIPQIKTKIWGNFVLAMRGWLTQQLQHLFMGGDETSVREFERKRQTTIQHGVTKSKPVNKMLKRTEEQMANRMAWNWETGAPQDEILVAIFRSIPRLFRVMGNIITLKYQSGKKVLSDVEKYAWKDLITYTFFIAALGAFWPGIHEWANDTPAPPSYSSAKYLKPGKTRDAELARKESSAFSPFEEGYYKYGIYKLQIDDLYFRLLEAKAANMDPTTVFQMVNSVTVLYSGISEWFSGLNTVFDATGFTSHSPTEIAKSGSYKNYQRWERDLYKTLGPIDNYHTSFSYYGLKQNLSFYLNKYGMIFNKFGVDTSISGIGKDTKSSKSKKHKSQIESPGFEGAGIEGAGFEGAGIEGAGAE